MTQLTHNFRNFYIKLKDGREINITKEQKETVMDFINSKVQFIEIPDADTGDILFSGKTQSIDEIIERKQAEGNRMVICDYGCRHPLINGSFKCDCKDKYGFDAIDFKIYMRDKHGIMYMQDTTEDQKREFYKYQKENESKRNG